MNKLHDFIIQHKKPLKYSFVVLGGLFVTIGISALLLKEWLLTIGGSFTPDGHCCICVKYFELYNTPLIIVGSFLAFPLLFEKQLLKIYEKCAVKPKIVLAIPLVLILIALGLISYFTFRNFPYSYDEYNFLYQAKIFSQGKLFLEIPEKFRPFVERYMILNDNKLFSKYPPGFPLILTTGVILGVPGLINPLLAVLTLIILYVFTKSFLGKKYGLLSVIIMSTTPYFLAHSASYYSQPAALFFTSLIFLTVRKYELTSKEIYLFLLGLASGYSTMIRPLDSFCVIVPSYLYLTYILYKKGDMKKIGYSIFTFAMVFALFLTYNYILIGKISLATYPIVKGEFKIVDPNTSGFIQNASSITKTYVENAVKHIPELFYKHFLVHTGFFVPLLAMFGFFFFNSKWKWVLILNILMLVIFYNFHTSMGWPQYGARYYYSGFFSFVFLAMISFKRLMEKFKNKNQVMYFLTFVLCVHVFFSFKLMNDYAYRFKVKLRIIEDIRKSCPDNSIVILDWININPTQSDCIRWSSLSDLSTEKRNMFMDTSRLMTYFDDPYLDISKIKSDFPDHSICYYTYNRVHEFQSYNVSCQ